MADEQVRSVMNDSPQCLPKWASCVEAARLMRDQGIGAVIVVDEDQRLCGVATDRDIVLRALALGQDPSQTSVGSICTEDPTSVAPWDAQADAIAKMSQRAVRRLPVCEDGRPIGMVSLGDLASARDPKSVLGSISQAPAQA